MHMCQMYLYHSFIIWIPRCGCMGKGTYPAALNASNTKTNVRNKSITHFRSLCRRVYLAQIAEIASYGTYSTLLTWP